MAHKLARELNVKVEFVQIDKSEILKYLKNGTIDIVMSGVILTTDIIKSYHVSNSYMDQTVAFIVPDYLRNKRRDGRLLRMCLSGQTKCMQKESRPDKNLKRLSTFNQT